MIQDLSGSWCIKGIGESTLVPLMHHDPDRSWITDPNSDHPKGTHSPVPLMHHDPDKSWITDPNSDHPKRNAPLKYFLGDGITYFKASIHDMARIRIDHLH